MANLIPVEKLPPAELLDQFAADAKLGVSLKDEDRSTAWLKVLQSNNPEVDKRGSDYINGAEAGDLLLRGAQQKICKGTEGVVAIHCGMRHVQVEWLPARQGYVCTHDKVPGDAKRHIVKDGGFEKSVLVRPNGNVVEDTRQICMLISHEPFLLACSSTMHKFARTWNSYFLQFRHPQSGAIFPSFARRYRLTTVPMSNAKGHWFTLAFTDEGWTPPAEYQIARALADIVERGLLLGEASDYGDNDAEPARVVDMTSAPRPAPGVA